jgi:hypothetical protein
MKPVASHAILNAYSATPIARKHICAAIFFNLTPEETYIILLSYIEM